MKTAINQIFHHLRYSRYKLILLILAAGLGAFTLQRLIIYVAAVHDSAAELNRMHILTAFVRGLQFDLVATGMLAAPIVLLLLIFPPVFDKNPAFRMAISLLTAMAATAILIICLADFLFFLEFGTRLDEKVIEYWQYDYIHKILIQKFHIIPILIGGLMALIGLGLVFYKKLFPCLERPASGIANFACFLLITALLAVSIRGSIGPKPLNTGPAYFSPSNRVAQLTLNGLFTLREATYSRMARGRDVDKLYDLLPKNKAFRITRDHLKTDQDQWIFTDRHSLDRKTDPGKTQKDYNVVLVVMESTSWPYIEPMGGMAELTPNLNRLAENGILMKNCFSVGTRTTRAFSGLIAGFPDLPGESITTREGSVGKIRTIGSILSERGYRTMFIYGGQPYYDHRQSFLGSNGFNDLVFDDEFPQKTFRKHLGWCDEDLFNAAHQTFAKQNKPFFSVLLTLSFHRDFSIPKGKITAAYPNHRHVKQIKCIQYMDWAIGQFMEKARQADYFENTLFVFTADHCGGFLSKEPAPTAQRIPFLIYAPEILGSDGRVISQVCSQTDIAPTIMDLLGGTYRHQFFGSSVLSKIPNKAGALLQDGHGILSYIDHRQYMVRVVPHREKADLYRFQPPDHLNPLKITPETAKIRSKLKNRCIAMIQTAAAVYHKQTSQLPETPE